jgi:uncharacterized membrane protein YraQ (UPF0718 family)
MIKECANCSFKCRLVNELYEISFASWSFISVMISGCLPLHLLRLMIPQHFVLHSICNLTFGIYMFLFGHLRS